jgi:PleD family two-component response regulator
VTFYPVDDADGETLLRHADQAMYLAKQAGKNRCHLYAEMESAGLSTNKKIKI